MTPKAPEYLYQEKPYKTVSYTLDPYNYRSSKMKKGNPFYGLLFIPLAGVAFLFGYTVVFGLTY